MPVTPAGETHLTYLAREPFPASTLKPTQLSLPGLASTPESGFSGQADHSRQGLTTAGPADGSGASPGC